MRLSRPEPAGVRLAFVPLCQSGATRDLSAANRIKGLRPIACSRLQPPEPRVKGAACLDMARRPRSSESRGLAGAGSRAIPGKRLLSSKLIMKLQSAPWGTISHGSMTASASALEHDPSVRHLAEESNPYTKPKRRGSNKSILVPARRGRARPCTPFPCTCRVPPQPASTPAVGFLFSSE